ncbi:hypothetical protein [Paenibacillus sp. VMFN-D1]|nr:hypothetical protein [Paenibacillus sp. VMFN-D1]RED34664.1 hypothetical protein C7820_4327 [Paenibacillus sp. VMFN-D1]
MSNAVYNLFLRNWVNNRATVEQIDLAVQKQLITEEEAQTIMETPKNSQ